MLPLLRAGLTLRRSLALAFASDTLSIATMELLDTLIILIVPGAINAGLGDSLFWGSVAGALFIALGRVPGKPRAHRPRQRARSHPRLLLEQPGELCVATRSARAVSRRLEEGAL
jgi:hypothetical protein